MSSEEANQLRQARGVSYAHKRFLSSRVSFRVRHANDVLVPEKEERFRIRKEALGGEQADRVEGRRNVIDVGLDALLHVREELLIGQSGDDGWIVEERLVAGAQVVPQLVQSL